MIGTAAALTPVVVPDRVPPTRAATSAAPRSNVVSLPAWARAGSAGAAARTEPHRPMELNLLGGFRLLVGGELVDLGGTGQRLLAAIACRGRQVTRGQIAQILWPEATGERAFANLRTALYRLCRQAPGVVHATTSHLQLPVGMHIDLERTSRLASRILSDRAGGDEALVGEALEANLYDDLLPDWDEEWLGHYQHRYRQLRLAALESLSAGLASAGQHGAAIQAALAAVQADSLRDSAHEALIRAHLAQGNRHEAYIHFMSYRRILRDELGLEPPASVRDLMTGA